MSIINVYGLDAMPCRIMTVPTGSLELVSVVSRHLYFVTTVDAVIKPTTSLARKWCPRSSELRTKSVDLYSHCLRGAFSRL